MKWIGRLMTSVAAVLVTAGGVSASTGPSASPADAAWDEAAKSDSLEAYAAFVMMYPDSEHARVAYDRLSGANTASIIKALRSGVPLIGDEQSSFDVFPGVLNII